MKLGHEGRTDRTHHLRIESIDEDDHRAKRRDEELKSAERLLIDEFAHVQYSCLLHGGQNITKQKP